MAEPKNFLSGKPHGLAIIIGKEKPEEEHEETGESSGYSEGGPAVCGKCSHFSNGHCNEEHVNRDPAVKHDDKGAVVDANMGWCHFYEGLGPQVKEKMPLREQGMMQEEEPEREHNYPHRFME